jgi:hypothetical protein
MDRQGQIETQIAATQEARGRRAQWWLMKRLARLTQYEAALIRYLYLHVGWKYRDAAWTLSDEDVMTYGLGCGRTTFFATVRSLRARSVLDVTEGSAGVREYRISWTNLLEQGLTAKDQRRYWEILGRSPGEIELLVSSVIRTADPPGGLAVRVADTHRKYSKSTATERQEPPPPPLVAPDGQASVTWDQVEAVAAALAVKLGMCDIRTPLDAVRSRVTPDHVLRVLEHCRAAQGAYGAGALHRRLMRCSPQLPPDAGWPEPARRQKAVGVAADDTRAYVVIRDGRRAGKSDDEIRAALAAAGLSAEF